MFSDRPRLTAEGAAVSRRMGSRVDRSAGPAPFSSEWTRMPDKAPVTKPLFELPVWMPSERLLSASLVLVLAFVVALIAILPGSRNFGAETALPSNDVAGSSLPPIDPTAAPLVAAEVGSGAATADPATGIVVLATPDTTAQAEAIPSAVTLPAYRIITFYGHPHDPNMGILGEHSPEELLPLLEQQVNEYAAIDPSRPAVGALELIATVAQPKPGPDGTYILDTDLTTLTKYIDFAEQHNLLVFLDVQVGRGTVATEFEKVRPLLKRPHVHLAIDPEFAMAEGEVPGQVIGSVNASSIAYAQAELAKMVTELNLPPKILIVHQFQEEMIMDKMTLAPVDNVQLVIDADGYGAPEMKIAVYNFLVRDEPIQFAGLKLFYKQDAPLLTPAEVTALNPVPDVIVYQ